MPVDIDQFRREGWLRIPSAAPKAYCERLVQALVRDLHVPVDEPERWPEFGPHMLDLVPIWGHQTQWDIRQHPNLHRIWATLWETEELRLATDCYRFSPPWRPGYAEPQGLHWDHAPTSRDTHFIQGVLALTDTASDQGGWRCSPSLFRAPELWIQETKIDEDGDQCWPADVTGQVIIHVPAKAGDLIVWDSHLPHDNSRNLSAVPRIGFYLSMNPASRQAESERLAAVDSWKSGRCVPWWRDRPGFDRIETWPPATLTMLGRRLLGVEPWQ